MGFRSCSGGTPLSRHPAEGHPQVLIIAQSFTRQTRAEDAATRKSLLENLASIRDVSVLDSGDPIRVERKRNVLRNRWGMQAEIEVRSGVVTVTVEGPGTMHAAFADEIFARLPEGLTDDHGTGEAAAKMPGLEAVLSAMELSRLGDDIRPGERVNLLARCMFEGRKCLLVVTDQRLLLKDQGVFTTKTTEINPKQVTSVRFGKSKRSLESLELTVSGAQVEISELFQGRGKDIASLIRDAQHGVAAAPVTGPAVSGSGAPSAADQLAQVAQLHASGALTDEEFAVAKARILGL